MNGTGSGAVTDLAVTLGPLELPNPVMTAAGTAGHGAELAAYFELGRLGAHVVKSLAAEPWPGNPPPRLVGLPGAMLNSVGLQGPGVARWRAEELPGLEASGGRVVVSIWGRRVEDYARAVAELADLPSCVVALEVNVSCPNLDADELVFSASPSATAEVLAATAAFPGPRFAKLAPNAGDLVAVAVAARDAGASGVTLVNTFPALAIDVEARRPLLGAGGGGLSGAALHPIALRCVYDVHAALPELPIIGVGGVSDARSALELVFAGASAVQVGTATLADPRAAVKVLAGLETWCHAEGVGRLADLIGAAHG